jgi:hypothetical protein
LWSKCRQPHSRTAFTTVSWFYDALTPRRQRKQKMKRMKPTMAITIHMHALHVVATSLNQRYGTFILSFPPNERLISYNNECGTIVFYRCCSYCGCWMNYWLPNSLG